MVLKALQAPQLAAQHAAASLTLKKAHVQSMETNLQHLISTSEAAANTLCHKKESLSQSQADIQQTLQSAQETVAEKSTALLAAQTALKIAQAAEKTAQTAKPPPHLQIDVDQASDDAGQQTVRVEEMRKALAAAVRDCSASEETSQIADGAAEEWSRGVKLSNIYMPPMHVVGTSASLGNTVGATALVGDGVGTSASAGLGGVGV